MVGPGGSLEDCGSMVGSPEDKGSRPDEDLLVIRVPDFGVGDSCLVESERIVPAVGDGRARNGVRRFPAQAGGPREGLGPIGAPDSGDDTSLRRGPRPALQVL